MEASESSIGRRRKSTRPRGSAGLLHAAMPAPYYSTLWHLPNRPTGAITCQMKVGMRGGAVLNEQEHTMDPNVNIFRSLSHAGS